MREAMRALGVSRQTVLQRVKRGELAAVHIMRGKQKGLRIKVIGRQPVCSFALCVYGMSRTRFLVADPDWSED